MDHEITSVDMPFKPKERHDGWHVAFGPSDGTGYDIVLLIENPMTKVSYQIEVGIARDGALVGQITPDQGDNGPDALVLMQVSPGIAIVSDNWGGPDVVIRQTTTGTTTEIATPCDSAERGFG